MQVKEAEPTTQPSVKSAAGDKGTLTETKAFTQEDVDKAKRDERNAVMGEFGKYKTAAEKHKQDAEAAEARIARMVADQDAREFDQVRDDPPALATYKERQLRRVAESELAKERTARLGLEESLKAREAQELETAREQRTRQAAEKFKVDFGKLSKLAQHTDGSLVAIEDIAKELNPKGPLHPDSGADMGGVMDRKELIAAYIKNPQDPRIRESYRELRRKEGR